VSQLVFALTAPATAVHASFVAAMEEFRAEGRGPHDNSMIGSDIGRFGARWADPEAFAEYAAWLRGQALEEAPRPPGHVPSTTLWWVSGTEFLGRIAIRHRLTPGLLEYGGHIGYDVRPSGRRRGHATSMLTAALPVAAGLGIDRVLVTCDADNEGSRKVIEASGGELEDQRGVKLRYWIRADASS
jgi:predicted acetyltransferase